MRSHVTANSIQSRAGRHDQPSRRRRPGRLPVRAAARSAGWACTIFADQTHMSDPFQRSLVVWPSATSSTSISTSSFTLLVPDLVAGVPGIGEDGADRELVPRDAAPGVSSAPGRARTGSRCHRG